MSDSPETPAARDDALVAADAPSTPACIDDPCAPPPETYDPADYRWVPVRRRPRYDGWTEEKQRRFIEVLADTGLVSAAAKAVGMTRESAYRLRRSAHGAAFARAWDAARAHAGSVLEDVAFERAIEGVEHNVYDEHGEVVCTKRVYNDRLLTFLLRHLKPDRYAREALARPETPDMLAVETSLRAMEPQLPAPAEDLLGAETLADELELAEIADGKLSHFLSEQRPPKSEARLRAEADAAREARGNAVLERLDAEKPGEKTPLTRQDWVDMKRALDPLGYAEPSRKRFR